MKEQEVAEETVETVAEEVEEVQTTSLLKPIRGTLQPVEEAVETSTLTPVGHMLVPEKRRGSPPPSSIGTGGTATLRPVRGTLTPVPDDPVEQTDADEEADED